MHKRTNGRSLWTQESLSKARPTKKSRMSLQEFHSKKPVVKETDIQQDFIEKLSLIPWKGLSLKHFVYAVPNGGFRSKRTASVLKAEGVLAGVPDLHCFIAVHPYHSLYIEMKTQKGDLTESQEDLIPRLRGEGHKVVVCRSVADALNELFKYLGI